MDMNNCPHAHLTDTGELRGCAGCRGSKDAPNLRKIVPVMRCNDCGAYVQPRGQELVPCGPPTPIEHVIMAVRAGRLTPTAALAQYGHLTPTERRVIEEMPPPCPHAHTEPVTVTHRCLDCGQHIQVPATP